MLDINISKFFPNDIVNSINHYFEDESYEKNRAIEEIRLRVDKQIILKFDRFEKILDKIVTQEEILKTMQLVCDNSIYTFQNQICDGFITVKGGHRIGITGNCVIENKNVKNINYISSLNFRVAKEIKGASNKLLKYLLDIENNSIYTTLIISPPGVRKNNNFTRFCKKY